MKPPVSLIFFLIFSACSCSEKREPGVGLANSSSSTAPFKKPASSFSDTLLIDRPSAILYYPDSIQLQKVKAFMEEGAYKSLVHDGFYLARNSKLVLKQHWPQVHIIEATKVRYLFFKKNKAAPLVVDLDTKGDIYGLFLFDGTKDPEPADMMNIETALFFYFSPKR